MVTLHRAHGFRFVIFSNDHDPAHVHVIGKGCEAKITLGGSSGPVVAWEVGFVRQDLRRVLQEVKEVQPALLRAWEGRHDR